MTINHVALFTSDLEGKTDNVFYDINSEVDSYLPHTKSASDINEPTSLNDSIS